MRTRSFWMIAGLYAVFGFCRSTYTAHLVAHVQDSGFSLADGANVLAVVVGASVFGRIGLGRVADIIGNRRGFIISFGTTALALLWLLVSRELWMFFAFAFVYGVAWGNQAVLRFSIASEYFGLASLGMIMGALGVGEAVAAMLGSFIAGYIFDVFGNYNVMFFVGVGVSTTGVILAWLLKPATAKGKPSRDVAKRKEDFPNDQIPDSKSLQFPSKTQRVFFVVGLQLLDYPVLAAESVLAQRVGISAHVRD